MIATSTCWTLGFGGLRFFERRSLRSAAAALAATGSAARPVSSARREGALPANGRAFLLLVIAIAADPGFEGGHAADCVGAREHRVGLDDTEVGEQFGQQRHDAVLGAACHGLIRMR